MILWLGYEYSYLILLKSGVQLALYVTASKSVKIGSVCKLISKKWLPVVIQYLVIISWWLCIEDWLFIDWLLIDDWYCGTLVLLNVCAVRFIMLESVISCPLYIHLLYSSYLIYSHSDVIVHLLIPKVLLT